MRPTGEALSAVRPSAAFVARLTPHIESDAANSFAAKPTIRPDPGVAGRWWSLESEFVLAPRDGPELRSIPRARCSASRMAAAYEQLAQPRMPCNGQAVSRAAKPTALGACSS